MSKKYIHTMDTLDGIIEWEDDIPPRTPAPTEAEKEIERKRLHPDISIASYLR